MAQRTLDALDWKYFKHFPVSGTFLTSAYCEVLSLCLNMHMQRQKTLNRYRDQKCISESNKIEHLPPHPSQKKSFSSCIQKGWERKKIQSKRRQMSYAGVQQGRPEILVLSPFPISFGPGEVPGAAHPPASDDPHP